MNTWNNGAKLALAVAFAFVSLASVAQTRKEMRFNVGPGSSLTITNDFGPVTVHVAPGSQILATATLQPDQMEIDQTHTGSRVELFTHSLQQRPNANVSRVQFDVTVPPDCDLIIHSSAGPISVEKVRGDVSADGDLANIDVHDVGGGHVHLRTLKGNITATNIIDGHVEISSVSGPVTLKNVSGPNVEVNTTNGVITYTGMFSDNGDYEFTTHSGDINVSLPANASVDVAARSVTGKVENDFPFHPKQHVPFPVTSGRAFAGTSNSGGSSVQLRSYSGTIRVKKQ
ncbi:MAG: DUF4097 family beta strand repeat-containing protein [Terriglobia bacterium]|nr:DUF4097 family beta strand repeat-containing protein [Terriglobia bacterium]